MKLKIIKIIIAALINVLLVNYAIAADTNYYAIIDAGSSGSRLYLFSHNNNKIMPLAEEVYSIKNSEPLASFNTHPDLAYQSLKSLLDNVINKIHEYNFNSALPITILGTGGMRLLSKNEQEAIYNEINNKIKADYKTQFDVKTVKTLSGKMEGVYGWLDVNYLLKNFQNNQPTVGSVDIGGASIEISYAVNKTKKHLDVTKLSINNINYLIFSKSFLGLGIDEARNSMNADINAGSCYPKGYDISQIQKGNFDLATCSVLYDQIIDNYNIAELNLETYKVPSFIAFSGAYYTYHFFNVDLNIPDQDTLEQNILRPVCSNAWELLQAAYPYEPEKYLSTYCSNAVFITHLLYGTFQLQNKQIKVMTEINTRKINWTLGALLYTIIKEKI